MPVFQLPEKYIFPNSELAEPDGLLAIGGDLSPQRLLLGYSLGLFPWYNFDEPILWWTPNPRMVLFPEKFYCSKNLLREVRSKKFEVRFDCNFRNVIEQCGKTRADDTWISEEILEAYAELHELGFAHSVEAYYNNQLVGGLYGVTIGKVFFGESMFHTMSNASKVAFYHLVSFLKHHNFQLIDAQIESPHLKSLGAELIARKKFTGLLEKWVRGKSMIQKWHNYPLPTIY